MRIPDRHPTPLRTRLVALAAAALVAGCPRPAHRLPDGATPAGGATSQVPVHTSTLALAPDQHTLWVVRPDEDMVSVVDVASRRLLHEIALGPAPQADERGDWAPLVAPRTLALSDDGRHAFVTGERSGEIVSIDTRTFQVERRQRVCARPVGVLVRPGHKTLAVTCAADRALLVVDPAQLQVRHRVALPHDLPWAMATDADGIRVHVTHLAGPGVTTVDMDPPAVVRTWEVPEAPRRGHRILAHGKPRACFDVAVRPGPAGQLWVAHELHADDTAQPDLDFESTVFPAFTQLGPDGRTLTSDSRLANAPGTEDGAFGDNVSGPRAVAFTPDGVRALVVTQASEDVLVVNVARGREESLLRPLPGVWPQGIVLSADGRHAYVDERNSGDIAVLALDEDDVRGLSLRVDGPVIPVRTVDRMPAELRRGQRVFSTANDTEIPTTSDHWLACASCHTEGRTDRITFRMLPGPRDVPSLAGGVDGFLLRTADRNHLLQFTHTFRDEMAGTMPPTDDVLRPWLDAMAAFVQHGIPVPPPPATDALRVQHGRMVFERPDVGCTTCHTGPRRTDSGAGNAALDLAGPLRLHDVGTCVTEGAHPDRAHDDVEGHPRHACFFDTPALRGLADSAPYLHDGSAATLRDVLTTRNPGGLHGHTAQLTPGDLEDLVEYLRSL